MEQNATSGCCWLGRSCLLGLGCSRWLRSCLAAWPLGLLGLAALQRLCLTLLPCAWLRLPVLLLLLLPLLVPCAWQLLLREQGFLLLLVCVLALAGLCNVLGDREGAVRIERASPGRAASASRHRAVCTASCLQIVGTPADKRGAIVKRTALALTSMDLGAVRNGDGFEAAQF